jgi:hypothetical protein
MSNTWVLELDDNGVRAGFLEGNVRLVEIGGTADETATNLRAAINDLHAVGLLNIIASGATNEVDLTAETPFGEETLGNGFLMNEAGATFTLTPFSGGIPANGASAVWASQLRDNHGAQFPILFEQANGVASVSLTLKVSATGRLVTPGDWTDLTVAAHGLVFDGVVLVPKSSGLHIAPRLRPGIDNNLLLLATGGSRFQMQVRRDEVWQPYRL